MNILRQGNLPRGVFMIVSLIACGKLSSVFVQTDLYDDTPEVLTPCIDFPFAEYEALGCPVVILYYSFWCHHCRTLAPAYKRFAVEMNTVDKAGIHVFAIDCMKYGDTCMKAGITSVPEMKFYDGHSWSKIPEPGGNFTSADILPKYTHLGVNLACQNHRFKEIMGQSARIKKENISQSEFEIQDFDFDDAFRYALRYEIPPCLTSKECNKEVRSLDDISFLSIPPSKPDAQFQHQVYCEFRKLVLNHMPYAMNQSKNKKKKDPRTDSLCSYTCGLWKLFHRLVQNEDAVKSLVIIRNYILTFFRCGSCREHFFTMCTESLNSTTVYDDNSARLWLWKAHNQVNCRINKPQWPARLHDTNEISDELVLKYLEEQYGCLNTHKIKINVRKCAASLIDSLKNIVPLEEIFPNLFSKQKKRESEV